MTARQLYVHPNTVRYRADGFRQLHMALKVMQLMPEPASAGAP